MCADLREFIDAIIASRAYFFLYYWAIVSKKRRRSEKKRSNNVCLHRKRNLSLTTPRAKTLTRNEC